jgi:hypothetical protein
MALRGWVVTMIDPHTFYGSVITAAAVGSAFVLLLIIAGYGFRIREITVLLQRLSRRLKRNG